MNIYIDIIKPTGDRILALIALILLLPLFILISILIKIDSKGPILFKQDRLGKNGRIFRIYKFRSMVSHQKQKTGSVLYENDPRITKIGRFIRKSSIDELPQIINILKAEMSFLGPRPPLTYFPKEFSEYSDFEKIRFNVKPGISGLAQIRCREIHDWDINIPIDIEYVENLCMKLDIKLFVLSVFTFFRTDNIYTKSNTTDEPK